LIAIAFLSPCKQHMAQMMDSQRVSKKENSGGRGMDQFRKVGWLDSAQAASIPIGNRLLSALPIPEYQRLSPYLQPVTFPLGKVLYEPGGQLDYVYFPTTSVVSLVYTMKDGATAEMGLIGDEGVIGIAMCLGGNTAPNRAVVQIGGGAVRLRGPILLQEFARGGSLQRGLLLYTQALLTQISQTAVCNRLHPLENRLCRWLLMCLDRVRGHELPMTQEFISCMLGGRRESVTVAAGHLQDSKLLHYSRGHITILDRKGLEANACECYRTVKSEIDRLLRVAPIAGITSQNGAVRGPVAKVV
jgi:CRP-like cAMP-binding protein